MNGASAVKQRIKRDYNEGMTLKAVVQKYADVDFTKFDIVDYLMDLNEQKECIYCGK